MRTIAEIGNDRLINVLVRDKNQSPAKTISILKSEITELMESYVELDDEIIVEMRQEKGRLTFQIKASAIRVKEFGTVS